MKLRPYQQEALNALFADWGTGLRRLGVSAATGTGKTVMMSHLAHAFAAHGQRVLILVHRDELVTQTVDKLLKVDSTVSVGVVKGSRNSAGAAIVVASVQTACRPKRLAQLGRFGLVICDEAHLSASAQWTDTLAGLGAWRTGGPVCAGFSATWTRADKKALSAIWEKISFELPIEWAIDQGFLVRPYGQYIRTEVRLSQIKQTAGDYNAGDLGTKLSKDSVRDAIVAGYREHAADRSGVVFAPTVETAEYFRAGFQAAGFTSEGLYGITSRTDSALIHKRHRAGDTQVLMSCTRLSVGWDAPWVSAGVIARPTVHSGLFIQMVGRLLRLHPGKSDAVILDPTGVLFRHRLGGVIDMTGSESDPDADPDERDADDDGLIGAEPEAGVDAQVSGYETIDLLGGGRVLRTPGGIAFTYDPAQPEQFIRFVIEPARNNYDGYAVGVIGLHDNRPGRWLAIGLTRDQAFNGRMMPDKNTIPDPMLRAKAATLRMREDARRQAGVWLPRGVTRGDLFDATSRVLAGRRLDSVQSWQ